MKALTVEEAKKAARKAAREKWELQLLFQLKVRGLDKAFVREYRLPEEKRLFRWDFGDPLNKVLIEVQGGIWSPGKAAHSSGAGIMRDQEKLNLATFHGYRVFQCNDNTLRDQTFIGLIELFYKRLSDNGQLYGLPPR